VRELAKQSAFGLLDSTRLNRKRLLLPGKRPQGLHRISIPATRAAATSIKPNAVSAIPSASQSLQDAGRGGLIQRRKPPVAA
jgi:hypothetical protein